jgi:hypothetical protein
MNCNEPIIKFTQKTEDDYAFVWPEKDDASEVIHRT